jgi:hypothetical protein
MIGYFATLEGYNLKEKKVFISQPMKGKTEEQIRKEREELVKQIEKNGGEVIDSIIPDFDETVYKEEKLAKLLVDLYGLENIPYVFPYFMVDITLSGLATDEWITEGLEEMDSLLDLAFLYILEFIIPNPQIVKAMLLNYAEGYRMRNNPPAVRFSFNRLSNEYIRISTAVNELRDENIIVP